MATAIVTHVIAFGSFAVALLFLLSFARVVSGQGIPQADDRLPLYLQAEDRAKELKGISAAAYGIDSNGASVNFPVNVIEKRVNARYPDDLITAKLADESDRELFNEVSPQSMALVKDKAEVIGLYVYEERDTLYFMDLWEYKDVFCTFLNLGCNATTAGTNYLDNRIPWFDRFIFFNDTSDAE